MRRMIAILLIMLFATIPMIAENLNFSLVIPEDYGVVLPPDAIELDRFVLALKDTDSETGRLLSSHYMDLGVLSLENENLCITLLYYGNKSEPYRVKVKAYSGVGWHTEDIYGELHTFPIDISWNQGQWVGHDISVVDIGDGMVEITIPPSGIFSGVPVVDLFLDWRGHSILYPGKYIASVELSLEIV